MSLEKLWPPDGGHRVRRPHWGRLVRLSAVTPITIDAKATSVNFYAKSPDPRISSAHGMQRPMSIVFERGAGPDVGGSWFFVVTDGDLALAEGFSCRIRDPRARGDPPLSAPRPCVRREGSYSSCQAAYSSQSRRQFVLAKSRRQRRPPRTSLAAVRIGWRINVRSPCALAAGVERLIGPEVPARRTMQVQIDRRTLESVLLALFAPMTAHGFGQVQIRARGQDDRIRRQQTTLRTVVEPPRHDVVLCLPAALAGQLRVREIDLDFRRIWDYPGHAAHLRGEGFGARHFAIFTKRVAPHLYPAPILIRESGEMY